MRRFEESSFERPRLDGVEFKTINQEENVKLVVRFEEDESGKLRVELRG